MATTYNTADLYDDFGTISRTCKSPFKDFGAKSHFYGQIRTVVCLNDNVLLKQTLSEKSDGGVLVVDAGGSFDVAVMGDNVASLGIENGWQGIIINGCIRDSVELGAMDFGIKALGSVPAKSIKVGKGAVDVPVTFGGVLFEAGQWIYCDQDGILVANEAIHLELI